MSEEVYQERRADDDDYDEQGKQEKPDMVTTCAPFVQVVSKSKARRQRKLERRREEAAAKPVPDPRARRKKGREAKPASGRSSWFQLLVSLPGSVAFLSVEASDTIDNVKAKLQDWIPSVSHVDLLLGEVLLEGGRTLADYNIQNGATLTMVASEALRPKVEPVSRGNLRKHMQDSQTLEPSDTQVFHFDVRAWSEWKEEVHSSRSPRARLWEVIPARGVEVRAEAELAAPVVERRPAGSTFVGKQSATAPGWIHVLNGAGYIALISEDASELQLGPRSSSDHAAVRRSKYWW